MNSKPLPSILLALAATCTLLHAATPTFETDREFTASGDFNGDGKLDVIIIDKPTGLYRVGTRTGTGIPSFANSRPTGVTSLSGVAVGKLNGTILDSFAVTAPDQNLVQVLSPNTTGYIEPKTILTAGIGPQTMCAIDITTGVAPTPEDDIALIVANDPTLGCALREIRSNAGAWSIIDIGDCPEGLVLRGNPLTTTVGGTALFGFIRDAGTSNTFHAINPTGVGFTEVLVSSSMPDNTQFITVPFESPNMDVVFYVPGSADVHVRRIIASGPNWILGTDNPATFSASIAQIIPVQDTTGMRMLVRFDNGSVALYSYTSAGGFGTATAIAPSGATGVLSGLVPVSGSAGFLLLYAPGVGQPSSTAISFANTGSGWSQTGITALPSVSAYSSYANILLLSNFPFREDNPLLLRSYHGGDWSNGVTVGGGPFNVNASVANYVSATTGIGASSAQLVGVATSSPPGTAVNQLHAQFSMATFDSKIGPVIEDVSISPVAGTYNKSIQITFSGNSGASTVYYRLGTSGSFTAYNAASPPWVFTDGTVQFYADRPGVGTTPTQSAVYQFTTPAALQDRDGDGVPDFVEVASGLDPSAGLDSDLDGFTDRDELAAGTNPKNAADKPSEEPTLSTMIVDVGVRSDTVAGLSAGFAQSGTTFDVTDPAGRPLGSHHDATLGTNVQGGEVGLGASSTSYGRVNVLNATGDTGFVVVRSEQNFTVIPSTGVEPRGREKLGIVPTPDMDGWSFGVTQGTPVATGTTFSWGGVNWQSGNANWRSIDDTQGFNSGWSSSQQTLTFAINGGTGAAASWKAGFIAAANRGGQPYAKIALTPVTTLEALIVHSALDTLFTARGYTPTTPDGAVFDSTSIGTLHDLRSPDAMHPTAPVVRVPVLLSHINAQLNGSDAGAKALRKLARDVYDRHESLATDHLGDMPTPLKALHTWVSTRVLPTEYQTGGSLSAGDLTDAATKLSAILAGITTRTSSTYTLYIPSTASPVGLTLAQNSGATITYALVDANLNAFALPADLALPTGTPLLVTAYNDLPTVASYTGLEVISLSVSSLPTVIDSDSDGDLLADTWEMHHFGSLAFNLYDIGDGGTYSLGEEYFRGTDPRLAGSSPGGPATPLVFSGFHLNRDTGTPMLCVNWPAAYSSFISVDFQASDDLATWNLPTGFNATDAGSGLFTKTLSFDRQRRFFRPEARLKR